MDGRVKFKLRILCMCMHIAMCVPVSLVEGKLFTYPRADGQVKMKLSMQNFVFVYPHADGKVMLVTYLRADGCS